MTRRETYKRKRPRMAEIRELKQGLKTVFFVCIINIIINLKSIKDHEKKNANYKNETNKTLKNKKIQYLKLNLLNISIY